MPRAIYIETSALLRAILEKGTSAEVEKQILEAQILVTSRLSIVECARALLRAGKTDRFSEGVLADQERQLSAFWQQCEVWEVSARVCDLAQAGSTDSEPPHARRSPLGHVRPGPAPDQWTRALDRR